MHVYAGVCRCIRVYPGVSRCIQVYPGIRVYRVYPGVSGCIQVYYGSVWPYITKTKGTLLLEKFYTKFFHISCLIHAKCATACNGAFAWIKILCKNFLCLCFFCFSKNKATLFSLNYGHTLPWSGCILLYPGVSGCIGCIRVYAGVCIQPPYILHTVGYTLTCIDIGPGIVLMHWPTMKQS